MGHSTKRKTCSIIGLIFISFITYAWTMRLPIIGDGLMHLADHTDLSVTNLVKCFYTLDGLGKPADSATMQFHRPVFDEIIVEFIKIASNYNIFAIRLFSVMAHCATVAVAFLIGMELYENLKKAVFLAVLFNFSLAYFSGIYEYGLSFSLWLTLFVLLAFYETVKYCNYGKSANFIGCCFWTFLAMYTKESAMTLGIAFTWYVFVTEYASKKRVSKKTIWYGTAQAAILFVYLITRMKKLGSLFTVTAGGIDAKEFSMAEILKKLAGYWGYSLNIPNHCFEAYLCSYLSRAGICIAVIVLCFWVWSIVRYVQAVKNGEIQLWMSGIAFTGMYFILCLPVFKTTRNATYYGDILTLFVLLTVIGCMDFEKKQSLKRFVLLLSYCLLFTINVHDMVKPDSTFYLKTISNDAKKVMEACRSLNPSIQNQYILLPTNWMKNMNEAFIYHHNQAGSFYKYNVDISKEVDVLQAGNTGKNGAIVDFFKPVGVDEIALFLFSEQTTDTKLAQVTYGLESNALIQAGFSYEDNYYYSEIDVNYKKSWSKDNRLYFVIPKECSLDIVGIDCEIVYYDYSEYLHTLE